MAEKGPIDPPEDFKQLLSEVGFKSIDELCKYMKEEWGENIVSRSELFKIQSGEKRNLQIKTLQDLSKALRLKGKTVKIEDIEKRLGLKDTSKTDDVREIFDIHPVQRQGENVFVSIKHDPDIVVRRGLFPFFVRVHFHLWSKYTFEIISVNLRYMYPTTYPLSQKLFLNGKKYEVDSSHCLVERGEVDSETTAEFFISRKFSCTPNYIDYMDFGKVEVILEIAGSQWSGIRHLTIEGALAPGGELKIYEVRFNNGT